MGSWLGRGGVRLLLERGRRMMIEHAWDEGDVIAGWWG